MNLLSSVYNYKCPRCRQGDIFIKPFDYKNPLNMPKNCVVCDQKTEPEPGFYYGAMFVSYVVTAFLYLGIIAFCVIVLNMTVNQAFLLLMLFVALTFFKTARLARSAWFHFMVKYEPNEKEK